MRKKAAPKKPRTAYELCALVARHILDEPRRYYQDTWFVQNKRDIKNAMGSLPACGTMACRAGWIVALHDGPKSRILRRPNASPSPVPFRANEILGFDGFETDALFDGSACDYDGKGRLTKSGTKAYARLGARGLREFMRKHAAHLKARLLKDVPKAGAR